MSPKVRLGQDRAFFSSGSAISTRVKICGITEPEDAALATECGADAVGLVFAPSPRQVTTAQAAEVLKAVGPFVTAVALFVDAEADFMRRVCGELRIATVQLHGRETPETVRALRPLKVIKALRVGSADDLVGMERYQADGYLLDARVPGNVGGTGKTFDWTLAVEPARRLPVILAGGLTPDNVTEAVRRVRPYGVDVSSGVESSPGRKDPHKVRDFVANARSAG